jgi:hypothetical protein
LWADNKIRHKRGEIQMKKLIGATLLSAVAMLAANTPAPNGQTTSTPAATSTKKAAKKHVKTTAANKTTVTPPAAATPKQ